MSSRSDTSNRNSALPGNLLNLRLASSSLEYDATSPSIVREASEPISISRSTHGNMPQISIFNVDNANSHRSLDNHYNSLRQELTSSDQIAMLGHSDTSESPDNQNMGDIIALPDRDKVRVLINGKPYPLTSSKVSSPFIQLALPLKTLGERGRRTQIARLRRELTPGPLSQKRDTGTPKIPKPAPAPFRASLKENISPIILSVESNSSVISTGKMEEVKPKAPENESLSCEPIQTASDTSPPILDHVQETAAAEIHTLLTKEVLDKHNRSFDDRQQSARSARSMNIEEASSDLIAEIPRSRSAPSLLNKHSTAQILISHWLNVLVNSLQKYLNSNSVNNDMLEHGNPNDVESSSTSSGTASSFGASLTTANAFSGGKGKQPVLGKRRQSEGDGGGDDDNSQPSKGAKKLISLTSEKSFACPYARGNPNQYPDCWQIHRAHASGIREHLIRNHGPKTEGLPTFLHRHASTTVEEKWGILFEYCFPHWHGPKPSPYWNMIEIMGKSLADIKALEEQEESPLKPDQTLNLNTGNVDVPLNALGDFTSPYQFGDLSPASLPFGLLTASLSHIPISPSMEPSSYTISPVSGVSTENLEGSISSQNQAQSFGTQRGVYNGSKYTLRVRRNPPSSSSNPSNVRPKTCTFRFSDFDEFERNFEAWLRSEFSLSKTFWNELGLVNPHKGGSAAMYSVLEVREELEFHFDAYVQTGAGFFLVDRK